MMFGTVMLSNSQFDNQSTMEKSSTTLNTENTDNNKTKKEMDPLEHRESPLDYKLAAVPTIPLTEHSYKSVSKIEAPLKYSNDSTANKLRNQQSHHHQHLTSKQELNNRSVNFDNTNANNQHVYSKINAEKIERPERRHREKRSGRDHRTNDAIAEKEDSTKIQVEILPQDDNWEGNTTAFTADLSDCMTEDGRTSHFNLKLEHASPIDEEKGFTCSLKYYFVRYFGFLCATVISFCAFITPILFIILPRLNIWQVRECALECEGLLVGIAFKMFILAIGACVLFARKPRAAQLPRTYELRTLLIVLISLMTFSYWLFYTVRIIDTQNSNYHEILEFTVSYVDVLLFTFIICVFVLRIRQQQPEFVVKMVRSPDGEQSEYNLGKMSIQRAAVWLLEQYYKDFVVYNPWLENSQKRRNMQLSKFEATNGKRTRKNGGGGDDDVRSIKSHTASMTGGNLNANDRFYEEYEYERRVRKRRARLLTTTEEAFTHISRVQMENCIPDENGLIPAQMDPFETAQAVFTSIARDLRRYLRVTRQQPYFTRESVIAHLANCISYDMSPKSFLQRYLKTEPLIFNERALVSNGIEQHGLNYGLNLKTKEQSWILICDTPLYQNCGDNIMFVLKQNEVSLMCTFKRLPRFNLIEDILDPQRNKFVIKFNSETTV